MLRADRGGGGGGERERERDRDGEEGRMLVRHITADDDDDGTTCCCRRDRETEEIDVGKRPRGESVELAVGRGEGGGGGGRVPVSGGRRARLLARMGIGRRSDGLRVIALDLAPVASRR